MSLITVIVPNFNKSEYLYECLNSIKQQTFKDFECIIIDDGSTDNSKKIIDQFITTDKRFQVFYNKNHGLAYSRNFAIKHAKGKFILPVDADDYIEKTYLSRAMSAFQQKPNLTLYYGKWVFIGYNAPIKNLTFGNIRFTSYSNLLRGNSIHCSCVYRRVDAIICGLYDESMKAYEDWEFLIRLLKNKPNVQYDPTPSLFYRQFEQSMTNYGHDHYKEIYSYIVNKNIDIFREVLNAQFH